MRTSDFGKDPQKDQVEITKQQQAKIQKVFSNSVKAYSNHVLFEIDLKNKTINTADLKPPKTILNWSEAIDMYNNKAIKRVDIFKANTVTKAEVVKKENCVYISAMNKENAIKILKRDFYINISKD